MLSIQVIASLLCVGAVGYAMWAPRERGGTGLPFSAWIAWHAVLAAIPFALVLPLGRWIFLVSKPGQVQVSRQWHRRLSITGVFIAFVSMFCVWIAHWPGKLYFGFDLLSGTFNPNGDLRRIGHIYCGYGLMLYCLRQLVLGIKHGRGQQSDQVMWTSYMKHSAVGKMLIVVGCVNIVVGLSFWDSVSDEVVLVTTVAAFGSGLLGAWGCTSTREGARLPPGSAWNATTFMQSKNRGQGAVLPHGTTGIDLTQASTRSVRQQTQGELPRRDTTAAGVTESSSSMPNLFRSPFTASS